MLNPAQTMAITSQIQYAQTIFLISSKSQNKTKQNKNKNFYFSLWMTSSYIHLSKAESWE